MSKLLIDKYPDLIKEWDFDKNKSIDINSVTYGSGKTVWWLCNKGHSYKTRVTHRTNGTKCKFCKRIVDYKDSFKFHYPELAETYDEIKNEFSSSEISKNSNFTYWFTCSKKHSFSRRLVNHINSKSKCPYCDNLIAHSSYNFKIIHPKMAKEWDYEKNIKNPEDYLPKSRSLINWICEKDKSHRFQARIDHRTVMNSSCPFCAGKKVNHSNSLNALVPKVSKMWDFEKNNDTPDEVTISSDKIRYWICKNNHSFRAQIKTLTPPRNNGCPYCSGRKPTKENNLKALFPDLAKEWDYKKNSKNPEDYTYGTPTSVYWLCSKKHSFRQNIYERSVNKAGCPYCANQKVGYGNDLKTQRKDVMIMWDFDKNNLNPSRVVPGTQKKAWWICKYGHSYYRAIYLETQKNPQGCPYCKITPRSKEEIYLLFELKKFFIIDENDHKIKLKRVADVDIKLTNEKIVIEYDGSYWHKDKADKDIEKTKALRRNGWIVIRIREKPLKILSRKYNVSSNRGEYKNTANKVLKKLNKLGFEINDLEKYLNRKTLLNKNNADIYIDNLLQQKNKD